MAPPRKTPADNAGSGATADLPSVPRNSRERDITNVAEVFARSGYFGMTAAQLATLIIVGESLGLDAGRSVFDLSISPADGETPAKVAYRDNRTYETAADVLDAQRAANGRESGNKPTVNDHETPDPALPAAEQPNNVVQMRVDPPPPADAARVRIPTADDIPAGEIAATGPTHAIDENPDPGPGPNDAEPPAGQSPEEFTEWRDAINSMLSETGAKLSDIETRLAKYDGLDRDGRRQMLEECQRYYDGKVKTIRADIVAQLAADGKKSPEQQTGFYLYADVAPDPQSWNYPEACKAQRALAGFLARK